MRADMGRQTGYENDLCSGALEEYWQGKIVLALKKRMMQ